MKVTHIRKTLTSFVNQREKIEGIVAKRRRPATTAQHAIERIKRHIGFLSNVDRPLSWAGMVVHMEDSILDLLPSECSRFKKQRAEVIAIVDEAKNFLKNDK